MSHLRNKMSDRCNILVMDKVLLMKTLSEGTRKRNIERLEEIGDIIPKMKKLVYDENYDENLNNLLRQVTVATASEIND